MSLRQASFATVLPMFNAFLFSPGSVLGALAVLTVKLHVWINGLDEEAELRRVA